MSVFGTTHIPRPEDWPYVTFPRLSAEFRRPYGGRVADLSSLSMAHSVMPYEEATWMMKVRFTAPCAQKADPDPRCPIAALVLLPRQPFARRSRIGRQVVRARARRRQHAHVRGQDRRQGLLRRLEAVKRRPFLLASSLFRRSLYLGSLSRAVLESVCQLCVVS